MRIYANSRNLRIIIAILLKRKWQGALARWREMPGKMAGKVRVSGKLDPIYALLLDDLLRQSRSSLVYEIIGSIAKTSALIASARFSANLAVLPLAEKYATSFLFM